MEGQIQLKKFNSSESLRNAAYWLAKADPIIQGLLPLLEEVKIPIERADFSALASVIVGQQLSGAAARTIYGRLVSACRGDVDPRRLLELSEQDVTQCGISRAKWSFLTGLAELLMEEPDFFRRIEEMSDGEARSTLLRIKGVGFWTADIFLLFHLSRIDVFPAGDGTLIRVTRSLYDLDGSPPAEQYAVRWKPYRSVAALLFWAHADSAKKNLLGGERKGELL